MAIGNDYKRLILSRTGLSESELKCPREKSDMTPCVARDGDLAITGDLHCVGCGADIRQLLKDEEARLNAAEAQYRLRQFERRLAMHRGISVPVGDGLFNWHQLCNWSMSVGYGVDLAWDNGEVTCENCLKILKGSGLLIILPTAVESGAEPVQCLTNKGQNTGSPVGSKE